MQTGVLRVLRATAASWWRHKELRRTGQTGQGEKSSVVVYYGQSRKDAGGEDDRSDGDDHSEEARIFRFQKSYRVFNACQIEGLPHSFYPDPEPVPEHPPSEPIPHMQAFFDAIDITTVFTGTEAYYLPPVDKVYMPSITRFQDLRHRLTEGLAHQFDSAHNTLQIECTDFGAGCQIADLHGHTLAQNRAKPAIPRMKC